MLEGSNSTIIIVFGRLCDFICINSLVFVFRLRHIQKKKTNVCIYKTTVTDKNVCLDFYKNAVKNCVNVY